MIQPSIGFIESTSIAKGIEATDAMLKVAGVQLVDAYAICPGKYLVMVTGVLADVQSSVDAGVETLAETYIDSFVIPNVQEQVIPAILGTSNVTDLDAVGIIETFAVASCIRAADACAKAASVKLIEIRMAKGISGKCFVTLTGEVGAVRSAINAGVNLIKDEGMIVQKVVIPQAHKELRRTLF